MSVANPLVDSDAIEAIAARLDLRSPNRGALDSIAKAVAQHYDVDGGEPPFECVVDLATAVGKTYVMAGAGDHFPAEGGRDFSLVKPRQTDLPQNRAKFPARGPQRPSWRQG